MTTSSEKEYSHTPGAIKMRRLRRENPGKYKYKPVEVDKRYIPPDESCYKHCEACGVRLRHDHKCKVKEK